MPLTPKNNNKTSDYTTERKTSLLLSEAKLDIYVVIPISKLSLVRGVGVYVQRPELSLSASLQPSKTITTRVRQRSYHSSTDGCCTSKDCCLKPPPTPRRSLIPPCGSLSLFQPLVVGCHSNGLFPSHYVLFATISNNQLHGAEPLPPPQTARRCHLVTHL